MRYDGSAEMSRAAKDDPAAPARQQAHDRLHRRRLAGAVAADEGDAFARVDGERDAVEDLRLAVPGVERGHLKHGSPRSRGEGRAAAEIDLAHARVVAHRRRRAFGDQLAARQDDDPVGMGEDDVHAVLGEQHADRLLVREPARQRHQFVPLARRHAGGRLVHQQQARPVGERDRQLDPLDVAVGQHAGRALALLGHADARQQRVGLGAELRPRRAPEAEHAARVREQGELHVLAHGERGEGLGDLERATDAFAPDRLGLQADQLAAGEPHRAGVGSELAADHVEAGRLAGAVGPDQRQHLAGGEVEADVVDGANAAERLGQSAHGEQARSSPHAASRMKTRFNPPATPSGKTSTSASIARPRSARQ